MGKPVGSMRKVTLDGVPFNVMADANADQKKGKFDTEGVPTSGDTIMQKTYRAQTADSIGLQANNAEADVLRVLSERINNFPMSYTTADGSTFRAVGQINYEGHNTEKGLATIQMIPESSDGFAVFLG